MHISVIPQDPAAPAPSGPRCWRAALELRFAQGNAVRTTLRHARHEGPLRVQRLFHPDADGTAHCYLLHPPGGVVLGDELHIDAAVESGTALITTPSAGRFYGVGDFAERQQQSVQLRVHDGATLWWLPQETILFTGSRSTLSTVIDLHMHAQLAWWEVVVLGCPAAQEIFASGDLRQDLRIRRGGRLLLEERTALVAGDRFTRSAMGLRGASTFGTMALTRVGDETQLQAWLETVNGASGSGAFSVTQRGALLLARYLGDDAARCRHGFSALWRGLCGADRGSGPSEPRIWHT